MKEHIIRKHPLARIPDNLRSNNNDIFQPSLQSSKILPLPTIPTWSIFQNYDKTLPLPITQDIYNNRKKIHNNFFKTIEVLSYLNLIRNKPALQFPYLYQNYSDFNINSNNRHYEALPNIQYGQPFLLKIYKCSICFRDTPIMFSDFEVIKQNNEFICPFNCSSLPSKTYEENYKNSIDPEIKKFIIKEIFAIIDKKDPQAKLYLKSISIPSEYYQILNIEGQLNYEDNSNENYNTYLPHWLHMLLIYEKFNDIENRGQENNWAGRLINTNNNSTEITRDELIQFINITNSTFGFFKLTKNTGTYYFFIYLQLEKKPYLEPKTMQ